MKKKLILPFIVGVIILSTIIYKQFDAQRQLATLDKARSERLEEIATAYNAEVSDEDKRKNLIYSLKTQFLGNEKEGLIHKTWKEIVAKTLQAEYQNKLAVKVKERGELSLVSFYQGNYPLQHTQVRVEIGSQVYDTTYVPSNSDIPIANYNSEEIAFIEQLEFNSPTDAAIIQAIAQTEEQKITVKLLGYHQIEEFSLTEEDIKAIRESLQLAEALRS